MLVAEPVRGVGLADLMGHESIRTTEHYYGRVTIEDVAAKVAETVGL